MAILRFENLTQAELNRMSYEGVSRLIRASKAVMKSTLSERVKKEEQEQISEYNKMLDYLASKKGR